MYSNVYDTKHNKAVGYNCPYKHKEYQWPAKIKSNHFIIGDSIVQILKDFDRLCWKIKLSKP